MKYVLCVTTGSDFHGKSEEEYHLLDSKTLELGNKCDKIVDLNIKEDVL
jgi:hypothetical protein